MSLAAHAPCSQSPSEQDANINHFKLQIVEQFIAIWRCQILEVIARRESLLP
jgi:hypothetical protein